MITFQRKALMGLLLISALFAVSAAAQVTPQTVYEAGKHYTVIDPAVPTQASDGQVEVIEIFSYACPHCMSFSPHIAAWEERMPSNVFFRRVPAMFNPTFQVFGRAFITADTLGVAHDTHAAMFDAIHNEKRGFRSLADIADFYGEHGIEPDKFLSTAESFPVVTRMNRENNDSRRYGLRGTPSLVVNGKYLVSSNEAVRSHQAMLQVVDFLVAQETAAELASTQEAVQQAADQAEAVIAAASEEG